MSTLPPISVLQNDPAVIDLREKITASKRFMLCWLAVVWYETLATLPDERRHMCRWISPMLQTLYGLLILLTISSVIMFVSATIMSIRVYALYNQSRKILFVLIGIVALELAAMIAATTRFYPLNVPPDFGDLVNLRGCVATSKDGRASHIVAIFWASPLAFDTAILALTVYNILVLNRRARHLPVLATILRDGLLFFGVISFVNLSNVVLYAQSDPVVRNFNNPTSVALTGILCSRLVLSLFNLDSTPPVRTSTTTQLSGWVPPFSTPSTLQVEVSPQKSFRSHKSTGEVNDDEEEAGQRGRGQSSSVELRTLRDPRGAHRRFSEPRSPLTRSTPETLLSLERCGLISGPVASRAISRPRPFPPVQPAPFSDVVPIEPRDSGEGRGNNKTVSSSKSGGGGGTRGCSTRGEHPNFAIVVERETVVEHDRAV
ncbi:hypothetical protein JCM10212_005533 [Sporobolomyces blumeae]